MTGRLNISNDLFIIGNHPMKWFDNTGATQYAYMIANSGEFKLSAMDVPMDFSYGAIGSNLGARMNTSGNWNFTKNLNVVENITADYFLGDGSQLTNLPVTGETDPLWTSNQSLVYLKSNPFNFYNSTNPQAIINTSYYLATNPFSFYNVTTAPTYINDTFSANYSDFLNKITWANAINGTLYSSTNPFNFYNSTDFDITDYYEKSNPFGFYNSTNPQTETDPVFVAWDNFTGIPHATPSDNDITHFSWANDIYDWAVGLFYNKTETDSQIESANTSMKDYSDNTFITQTSEEDLNVNNSDTWNGLNTTTLHQVSSEGIVLGMNFNSESISGTTVLDSSAENNHGTNNGSTHNTTGGFNGGGCFEFDGDDDYIISTNQVLDSLTSFTISGWMNANNWGNIHNVLYMERQSYPSKQVHFSYEAGTGLSLAVGNGTTGSTINYDFTADNNKWYLFSATFNSGTVNIYVNGDLKKTEVVDEVLIDTGNGCYKQIGRFTNSDNFFNGSIDEVRIYNRALSADEIRNLYEQKDEIHDPFVYKTV